VLTRKLDLRSGRPVWFAYPRRVSHARAASRDFKTEVLVVGAGISGALVAHQLTKRGYRVAMIDRRGPLAGSTVASTALLQFEIDTPLTVLKRRIGARNAGRAWLRSKSSLDRLGTVIEAANVRADLRQVPSVYLSGNELGAGGLRAEALARQRIGLPAEYLDRRRLFARFGLRRAAAIASRGNLSVDPRALAAGLQRRACEVGLRLLAPYELTDLQPGRNRVIAVTRQGLQIEAQHVVVCTGYEMIKLVPATGHTIASTWVMATRPQPQRLWPEQALIWEASDPYLYIRSTVDGRVICGGEDEPFADESTRDALLPSKSRLLQKKLALLLPDLDTRAEFSWTGSFGQTTTGLPSIGAIPGCRRCYAVLGYGGNGITFSMLAAELIEAAIAGRRDPDQDLFAFK
jgi:glycine/D-amino acid oxidase-like deaminating enzyme